MTTINSEDLFTTESRRLAIISLVTPNEKEFPIKWIKSSHLCKLIPKDLLSILEEFFNYPIVEKPIVIPEKSEPKAVLKPKTTIYSKSVFSIISEHDPVSKTRYKYIGGEWVGGDILKSLYTPFRVRNYEEEISKTLLRKTTKNYEQYHLRTYEFSKEPTSYNELFYLSISSYYLIKRKTGKKSQKKRLRKPFNSRMSCRNLHLRKSKRNCPNRPVLHLPKSSAQPPWVSSIIAEACKVYPQDRPHLMRNRITGIAIPDQEPRAIIKAIKVLLGILINDHP